jgi:hypothetical protein
MSKHIKSYSTLLTESIQRGAIVLVKGKPKGGKCKLYATHVLSSVTTPQGAVMLYLSDDFHRIKEVEGELRATKVGYRSEDELKASLNLKSPGKISVVRNNNKTPLHWKTLKHTTLYQAIRDIKDDLIQDNFLLENDTEHEDAWNTIYNRVIKRVLNTAFIGKKEIDFLEYELPEGEGAIRRDFNNIDDDEYPSFSVQWSLDLIAFVRDTETVELLKRFDIIGSFEVTIFFDSQVNLDITGYAEDDRGYIDHRYPEYEIDSIDNTVDSIYLEGGDGTYDSELKELVDKVTLIIKELDDSDILSNIILPNLRNQLLLTKKGS